MVAVDVQWGVFRVVCVVVGFGSEVVMGQSQVLGFRGFKERFVEREVLFRLERDVARLSREVGELRQILTDLMVRLSSGQDDG